MHNLVLVTMNYDRHASTDDVQQAIEDRLYDGGFVNQDRFGPGWGDWFEIGGRWAGELSRRLGDPQGAATADVQIVTPELYDAFLKPFEGEHEVHPHTVGDGPGFADLDMDEVCLDTHTPSPPVEGHPDVVKWVCVIDLHS